MKSVDKLLLGILILLLPLGLLATHMVSRGSEDLEGEEMVPATVEDLQQILDRMQQPVAEAPAPVIMHETLNISNVTYSSDSGVLEVVGSAPDSQLSVMVSATVLPVSDQQPQEISGDAKSRDVLGHSVELRSIRPQPGGSFVFHYLVPVSAGAVEIRFDQARATSTVVYDKVHDVHSVAR